VENSSLPDIYATLSLSQLPRILSLQDRNPFSPTYGCFHRSYWLHRMADFPTAIAQLGVHTLALVWAHKLKDNPYYQKPQILEWCIAGIEYWMGIQKSDGSFDEWYPNERGWAGPTGYLVHAMADTYFSLADVFPEKMKRRFTRCMLNAARYLVKYNEQFVLANHHAIALLPIYEAYVITRAEDLLTGFNERFEEFLTYCYDEGWCLEYDGTDIGYLSGTVSFLSRLHRLWPDKRMEQVIHRAIDFTSYFLYPDGFYGGSMGSRETSHFYHFGYEYWAGTNPMAAKMAEYALCCLQQDKLVAPGTQEDHYVLYRVPEFIEAFVVFQNRPSDMPMLPFEGPDFEKYFPQAGIFLKKKNSRYLTVNLNRGGVIKWFDTCNCRIIYNDNGWIGKLGNGKIISSLWNGNYKVSMDNDTLTVAGDGHYVVTKLFSPIKMIVFRLFMIVMGSHPKMAHQIKAFIRRLLIVGSRKGPVSFKRTIEICGAELRVKNVLSIKRKNKLQQLQIGGQFNVRYVPQSRYFQLFELNVSGRLIERRKLDELNKNGEITVETRIS
jgi:hypothetical protein